MTATRRETLEHLIQENQNLRAQNEQLSQANQLRVDEAETQRRTRTPMGTRIPIYQMDAFTTRPFGGNPAAIMLLPFSFSPPDRTLLQIAAENNLSETAFVQELSSHPQDNFATGCAFRLRWFTPTREVNLCGHATLATAAVLVSVLGN